MNISYFLKLHGQHFGLGISLYMLCKLEKNENPLYGNCYI